MPDTLHPDMGAWITAITDTVGTPDSELILIGHSIGTVAILRYIESLPADSRIAGALLVTGFLNNIDAELDSFFRSPFDYGRIQTICPNIIAIESDTDPAVPPGSGAQIRDHLGARLITLHDAGYMNASDGFSAFPAALTAILSLIGKNKARRESPLRVFCCCYRDDACGSVVAVELLLKLFVPIRQAIVFGLSVVRAEVEDQHPLEPSFLLSPEIRISASATPFSSSLYPA